MANIPITSYLDMTMDKWHEDANVHMTCSAYIEKRREYVSELYSTKWEKTVHQRIANSISPRDKFIKEVNEHLAKMHQKYKEDLHKFKETSNMSWWRMYFNKKEA